MGLYSNGVFYKLAIKFADIHFYAEEDLMGILFKQPQFYWKLTAEKVVNLVLKY